MTAWTETEHRVSHIRGGSKIGRPPFDNLL